MPQYRLTSEYGVSVVVRGDSPPTAEDAEEIFNAIARKPAAPAEPPHYQPETPEAAPAPTAPVVEQPSLVEQLQENLKTTQRILTEKPFGGPKSMVIPPEQEYSVLTQPLMEIPQVSGSTEHPYQRLAMTALSPGADPEVTAAGVNALSGLISGATSIAGAGTVGAGPVVGAVGRAALGTAWMVPIIKSIGPSLSEGRRLWKEGDTQGAKNAIASAFASAVLALGIVKGSAKDIAKNPMLPGTKLTVPEAANQFSESFLSKFKAKPAATPLVIPPIVANLKAADAPATAAAVEQAMPELKPSTPTPDASQIPSPTSVPESQVRTRVGETPSLRQQGEAPSAQVAGEVPQGQENVPRPLAGAEIAPPEPTPATEAKPAEAAPPEPTPTPQPQAAPAPVTIEGYHGTRTDVQLASQFGGVHIGTEKAANERLHATPSQRLGGKPGSEKVQRVKVTLKQPYGTQESPISETDLFSILNIPIRLQSLKDQGYDGIIYRNSVEDVGSISAVAFDPKRVETVSTLRAGGTSGPMLVRENAPIISKPTKPTRLTKAQRDAQAEAQQVMPAKSAEAPKPTVEPNVTNKVRLPMMADREAVIRKGKLPYDPKIRDYAFEEMPSLPRSESEAGVGLNEAVPTEGKKVYVKDSEDQMLHGAVLLRQRPYDQLTEWEWLWLEGPSKGTIEAHYGRTFFEAPKPTEPTAPYEKTTQPTVGKIGTESQREPVGKPGSLQATSTPKAKEPWEMTAVEARATFPTLSQADWDTQVTTAWKSGKLTEESSSVRSMMASKPRDFGEIDAVLNGRISPSKDLLSRHPDLIKFLREEPAGRTELPVRLPEVTSGETAKTGTLTSGRSSAFAQASTSSRRTKGSRETGKPPTPTPVEVQGEKPITPGPGAASPAEFLQRERVPEKPPGNNPPVIVESGDTPSPEVVRRNKDSGLFSRITTPQWNFYFGRLGEAAKEAWTKMALGEFAMRESIQRDINANVRDVIAALPANLRARGGKAFFDILDGKKMEDIEAEYAGKPGGDVIIAQAEKVKTRLEEIRTTIRDLKRDSFRAYLENLDKDTLSDLYQKNMNAEPTGTKADLAEALSRSQFPDDWGIADGSYLPHLFQGQWKVTMNGNEFITRAQTVQQAKAKIFDLVRNNPEYKNASFSIEQDTIIPADMIRLGDKRFWAMIGEMKEKGLDAADAREAVQGIIGRKAAKQKWWGSLQKRLGFEGYERNYERIMSSYLSGFHRWKTLSELNRQTQPLIERVRSEGRLQAADRLTELLENLWGKPAKSTLLFDNTLKTVPLVRDIVKPLALDRWGRAAMAFTRVLTLTTPRYAILNRLQPLQGLYPLVGERGLVEAKVMQHTKYGRELLKEAGVDLDVGQYSSELSRVTALSRLREQVLGEKSNQEVAFLAMYQHGRRAGLDHGAAINYGKLRGQLMTQFTPLIVDTPWLFEGPFGRAMFQYKRFPLKTVELYANMLASGNLLGMGRLLGVFALLGGASFFLRQTWQNDKKRYELIRNAQETLGERGANTMMYGLPGFFGTDFSGSLVLGDEPFGENIYEKAARQFTGPALSMAIETGRRLTTPEREPMSAWDKAESVLRGFPALRFVPELRRLSEGDYDLTTPDGETKFKRDLKDVLVGLGAFRSANEANVTTAMRGFIELEKEASSLKNRYYVARKANEDVTALKAEIQAFNQRWPERPISTEELSNYLQRRRSGADKTDVERVFRKHPLPAGQR